MELISLKIPYEFISSRARLNWHDVLFGLDNQLLEPAVPVDVAIENLIANDDSHPAVVELAGLSHEELNRSLVEQLAEAEDLVNEEEVQRKWMYLALSWLYEKRPRLEDPLQEVEKVYADFGYPEEIASLVRYMPSEEPNWGRKLNEERLYRRWKEYLDERYTEFASDISRLTQ